MSAGVELCPKCVSAGSERLGPGLASFTNGMGGAYLECLDCGYVERVVRIADPHPTPSKKYTRRDGYVVTRYSRANVEKHRDMGGRVPGATKKFHKKRKVA